VKFSNTFTVSLPPDRAWDVLLDVRRIAPCFPGAELIELTDDRHFKGKVSVKLGPIALTFIGNAALEEVDEVSHSARIKASGSDKKGRGKADANVTFDMTAVDTGTRVDIETDLVLSGMVAQYGRGVGLIKGMADQLIGQFAAALEAEIAGKRAKPATAKPARSPQDPDTFAAALDAPRPPRPAKPISGFTLFFNALRAWVSGLFSRAT
jgi:carbon monoxide dehydrogenase subunit G